MKIQVNDLSVSFVSANFFKRTFRRHTLTANDYVNAVKDVSLTVNTGDIVSVVGPNGAGKTTLLRALCNLESIVGGEILYDDTPSHTKQPSDLPVRFVEGDAYYPHFDVAKNIAYTLQLRGFSHQECVARLDEALYYLGIEELRERTMNELSMGQKQRVVMARMYATIPEKPILFFDEPFSHIDPLSKEVLLKTFKKVFDRPNVTVVYVTHDREEALEVSGDTGSILVMRDGVVEQCDTLSAIAARPANTYVRQYLIDWIRSQHDRYTHLHENVLNLNGGAQ